MYFSEEEGERYLMLEEHQQANQHTENTVLTLPDNQHTAFFHRACPQTAGPKIVELEEENLEKTACFNGELDQPQPSEELIATPASESIVNMTGFQQNNAGPVPALVPPLQTGAHVGTCHTVMINQGITQPMAGSVPGVIDNNCTTAIMGE